MTDPERYMRKIQDIIGDISKRFKQLRVDNKQCAEGIERNIAFGIPAGSDDLKTFEKWLAMLFLVRPLCLYLL